MSKFKDEQSYYESCRKDCAKFEENIAVHLYLTADYCKWRISKCKDLIGIIYYQTVIADCNAIISLLLPVDFTSYEECCSKWGGNVAEKIEKLIDRISEYRREVFHPVIRQLYENITTRLWTMQSDILTAEQEHDPRKPDKEADPIDLGWC